MAPYEFWQLADRLILNEKNPEGFHSAVSRAYYAAFLTAVDFLARMSVFLSKGAGKHTDLFTILGNTGDAPLLKALDKLMSLRDDRNAADYDLNSTAVEQEAYARGRVTDALNVIAELNRCRLDAPRFAAVTAATRAWVKKLRGIP